MEEDKMDVEPQNHPGGSQPNPAPQAGQHPGVPSSANSEDEFMNLTKGYTGYFAWYRHKALDWDWPGWHDSKLWEDIEHPKRGDWPGITEEQAAVEKFLEGLPFGKDPDGKLLSEHGPMSRGTDGAQFPKTERNSLARSLASTLLKKHNLCFSRVVGYGGLGLAALFDFRNDNGIVQSRYVVKCMRPHAGDRMTDILKKEKKHMMLFKNNQHVVNAIDLLQVHQEKIKAQGNNKRKRVDLSDEAEEQQRTIRPKVSGETQGESSKKASKTEKAESESTKGDDGSEEDLPEILEDDDILIMEYCQRGDLERALKKIVANDRGDIPDGVLWSIFECLVIACMSIAFPVKPGQAPDLNKPGHLIHFDIDPSNVFISDFGAPTDPKHQLVPIFKIGDLGMMENLDPDRKNGIRQDRMDMWHSRRTGKTLFYTPEQFTEEWDFIEDFPKPGTSKVAGNYTWKTNLWQVALVMWCLITQYLPPPAPKPTKVTVSYLNNKHAWTWGGHLLDDDQWDSDRELRVLVAFCMLDEPADRPGFHQLRQWIGNKVNALKDDQEKAAECKKKSELMFAEPPAPPQQHIRDLHVWIQGRLEQLPTM